MIKRCHLLDVNNTESIRKIRDGARLKVPKRIRWRQEDGFNLLNIRWGNTIEVSDEVAAFFKLYQKTGSTFTIDDFGKGPVQDFS